MWRITAYGSDDARFAMRLKEARRRLSSDDDTPKLPTCTCQHYKYIITPHAVRQ